MFKPFGFKLVAQQDEYVAISGRSAPWVLLALLALLFGTWLAADLHGDYQASWQRARENLQGQSESVASRVSIRLEGLNRLLDLLRDDLRPVLSKERSPAWASARLEGMVAAVHGLRAVLLIDAAGNSLAASSPQLVGLNFHGSERYKVLERGSSEQTLHIPPPFVSPLKNYVLPAGKVFLDDEGRVAGYLLAILDASSFLTLFPELGAMRGLSTALVHGGGMVVVAAPGVQAAEIIGLDLRSVPDALISPYLQSGTTSAIAVGPSRIFGGEHLAAFQTIQVKGLHMDQALIVGTSTPVDAILASWYVSMAWRSATLLIPPWVRIVVASIES